MKIATITTNGITIKDFFSTYLNGTFDMNINENIIAA
jgi:hypothetical protein